MDNGQKHSLLSYLNHLDRSVYLRLSLVAQDTAILEKTPFPFLVIAESDPLARMFDAQFVTDAECEIRKVFFLVQRDQYLLTSDELRPISNRDVDDAWQKAFSFFAKKHQDTSLIILSNQINEKGKLAHMSSLFFCKTKQVFFHPPCPKCGFLLHQCEDDELLASLGLQTYSHSLKRYLYCSSCSASGNHFFYVYELDRFDPPSMKDRWALIKEFAQLSKERYRDTQFPCGECPNYQECFGLDHKVLSRIVPFSFYPFYMFLYNAMSLTAIDFLSILSGASFEEIEASLKSKQESGRINYLKAIKQNCFEKAPFLYDYDERHFLEILYLKLSFLVGVLQNFRSENNLSVPTDLRLSIDQIWVKLAEQCGFLPFLWNFKVNYVAINKYLTETPFLPKSSASDIGLIWFYTLLANKKQNMLKVSAFLREIMGKIPSADDASFEKLCKEGFPSPLLPENIFWNPEGKIVGKNWQLLWERSLRLGWTLLMTAFHDTERFKTFFQKLENLREEIRHNLFREENARSLGGSRDTREIIFVPGEPKTSEGLLSSEVLYRDESVNTGQSRFAENKAIHEILLKIIRKGQAEIEEGTVDNDKTVTIILKDLKNMHSSEKDKELLDGIPETVIFTSGTGKGTPNNSIIQEKIEETVIFSLEGLKKERSSGKLKEPQEVLPETVIISPQKRAEEILGNPQVVKAKDSGFSKKDFSSRESGKLEYSKENVKTNDEMDFIAETVIIRPEKAKDKNGNKK